MQAVEQGGELDGENQGEIGPHRAAAFFGTGQYRHQQRAANHVDADYHPIKIQAADHLVVRVGVPEFEHDKRHQRGHQQAHAQVRAREFEGEFPARGSRGLIVFHDNV